MIRRRQPEHFPSHTTRVESREERAQKTAIGVAFPLFLRSVRKGRHGSETRNRAKNIFKKPARQKKYTKNKSYRSSLRLTKTIIKQLSVQLSEIASSSFASSASEHNEIIRRRSNAKNYERRSALELFGVVIRLINRSSSKNCFFYARSRTIRWGASESKVKSSEIWSEEPRNLNYSEAKSKAGKCKKR